MAECNRFDNLMWLSYARRRLNSGDVAEMESHAESCQECGSQLDFFRKIASIVDLNSAEPPESWMEEAAAKFAFADSGQESSNIFGDLVFDSYVHAKEAVRSRSRETRHLVFDLPKFEVDLALEFSGRQLNLMMGHLLSKAGNPEVQALSLDLLVADNLYSTKPNSFGEFSFSVAAQMTGEPLELRCTFEEGPCVTILIPC